MNYYKYTIFCEENLSEILIALLSEASFDTFEENGNGLCAYLPVGIDEETVAEELLEELQNQFDFTWEKELIEGQNWNVLWESNFHPVVVDKFCAIRADFHDPIEGVEHELIINPKMAFGTGHHETTWMCLHALASLPVAEKALFDYGCGTGILAIMASKLGAASIEAIDIEEESYLNTLENARINGVENITARKGTLEVVENGPFDGILANINRHIILESLPQLATLCRPGGWLLVSGILIQDESIVLQAAEAAGFQRVAMETRGNWICMHLVRI